MWIWSMCGAVVTRLEEDGRCVIIGGDRYIVVELAKPQVAFFVVNQYQGQGGRSSLDAPSCRHCP